MSSVLKKAIKNAKFFLKVCYYSKTPSYDHPVNMTTSLIRPHFFWPQQKPFLVFYGLFYKRNRKHSPPPVSPYVIETLVEVWENSKLRGKISKVFFLSENPVNPRNSLKNILALKGDVYLSYTMLWIFSN